jgi:hypothetical protein
MATADMVILDVVMRGQSGRLDGLLLGSANNCQTYRTA